MTKDEISLILYLETRIVDRIGRVDMEQINDVDLEIINKWKSEGLIQFGRIKIKDHNSDGTHWVDFSEKAWDLAHSQRQARGKRMVIERNYERTSE